MLKGSVPLKSDLHVDPVGVLDVQAGIGVVFDARAALHHIARSGFLGEARYADREVIDNSGRALMIERDQRPGVSEANDSERLVLADHREAEHFFIEVDGTLQIRDLNADMVDVRGLEVDLCLGGGSRSGGSSGRQQRESADELSTAERALLELSHKIGDDRFHGGFLSLEGQTWRQDYRASAVNVRSSEDRKFPPGV